MAAQLVLVRHGQSLWNAHNRFTGWVDVPLSQQGIDEALTAGTDLSNMDFDAIYTSTLMRAQQTAMLIMSQNQQQRVPILTHPETKRIHEHEQIHDDEAESNRIPVYCDWRLNERFYGDLQGLNKDATREKYGAEQVKIWRRSFDVPPPNGESLAMTCERTIPCLKERLVPELEAGKCILVAAHGNSLRSIVMEIEQLTPEQVLELELATGIPRVYRYEEGRYLLTP